MQLSPRYESPPVLRIDLALGDPSIPLLRQRRRLAEVLATFDAEHWSAPSRCEGWSTKDVIAHLVGTNVFWTASIRAGLAGAPTRFLTAFDPATTPAEMVEAVQDVTVSALLEQFEESNEVLAGTLGGLGPDDWLLWAEAPPGHVAVQAVTLHALWDSWVHERDILLPLGLEVPEESDEVAGCLVYASALGPAFLATTGSERLGTLAVAATDLELGFVVDLGPSVVVRDGVAPPGSVTLAGPGAALVESLSCRGQAPPLPEAEQWMVRGLTAAFAAGG